MRDRKSPGLPAGKVTNYNQAMYRISPEGDTEVIGSNLPVDMYSIDIAANGDNFFNASDGIFRVY